VTASFGYDPLGRRQGKTVNATAIQFLYDGLNPVQEQQGGSPVANLLTGLGIDEHLTRTDATGASSFLTDALGSTIALAGATGSVATTYTYEPFGATAISGAATGNSFDYSGRENDGTGLNYYRARYYHPGLQRFISEDLLSFAAGDTNAYAYVANGPAGRVDPLGLTGIPNGAGVIGVDLNVIGITGFEATSGVFFDVGTCANGGKQYAFGGFAFGGFGGGLNLGIGPIVGYYPGGVGALAGPSINPRIGGGPITVSVPFTLTSPSANAGGPYIQSPGRAAPLTPLGYTVSYSILGFPAAASVSVGATKTSTWFQTSCSPASKSQQ
jgi:RHS repeat-associated protein